MIIFRSNEFNGMTNPTPGSLFRQDLLPGQTAKNVGGLFGVLPPGGKVAYHYHQRRESIIMIISGEATETIEGKEYKLNVGDAIYIPPLEKHMIGNKTNKDVRYFEFFTYPPVSSDFIEVK